MTGADSAMTGVVRVTLCPEKSFAGPGVGTETRCKLITYPLQPEGDS